MQAKLNSALMEAASSHGNIKNLELLLKGGANINARDSNGETALMRAVSDWGNIEAVKPLIAAGADVNVRDNNGETVLMLLMQHLFVPRDANELQNDITQTKVALKHLLDAGADVNATDNDGLTALHKSLSTVFGFTQLLEAGADANAASRSGETVLMRLAQSEDESEWLGNEGAIRGIAQHCFGMNVSRKAGVSYRAFQQELTSRLFELLLDAGANINAPDKDGWTALHFAVGFHNIHFIKLLLDAGADVNATDNDGKTALALAQENGAEEVAALLRAAGAKD